jgi:hypothetical protein
VRWRQLYRAQLYRAQLYRAQLYRAQLYRAQLYGGMVLQWLRVCQDETALGPRRLG